MKLYEYREHGKRVIYEGWDRSLNPPPEFIALVRDDDVIDVLALDTPFDLDGVQTYVDDTPCCQLFGVWRKYITVDTPVDDSKWPLSYELHRQLAARLDQDTYDALVAELENTR